MKRTSDNSKQTELSQSDLEKLIAQVVEIREREELEDLILDQALKMAQQPTLGKGSKRTRYPMNQGRDLYIHKPRLVPPKRPGDYPTIEE